MRKIVLLGLLAVFLCGGGYAAFYWFTDGRYLESTDNAYVQADNSSIAPRVQGYVREVAVGDNQRVKQGDVLVRLDDADFAAKFADAEAAVQAQQAALGSNDSKIQWQRSNIERAKAQIGSVQADLDFAQHDYARYQSLIGSDFVTKQKFETARADLEKQRALLATAQANLAAEQQQLIVLQAGTREIEARLAQMQAQLALVRNDLDNTVIRAPIDGVVGNRTIRVGQFVKQGAQMMVIVPLPNIYIVANFKETQLAHMRAGQKVTMKVDAFPGRRFAAHVESFAPASGAQFSLLPPENATGNFTKIVQRIPVRIALDDAKDAELLRPGMSVDVTIDTRTGPSASTAPSKPAGSVVGSVR
jgi:membrane fusion protein (multidrug efflux system)